MKVAVWLGVKPTGVDAHCVNDHSAITQRPLTEIHWCFRAGASTVIEIPEHFPQGERTGRWCTTAG